MREHIQLGDHRCGDRFGLHVRGDTRVKSGRTDLEYKVKGQVRDECYPGTGAAGLLIQGPVVARHVFHIP